MQPFSSQTRAAALTGRYSMRYGLQTMQIQWFSEFALPEDEMVLPPVASLTGTAAAATTGSRDGCSGCGGCGEAAPDPPSP